MHNIFIYIVYKYKFFMKNCRLPFRLPIVDLKPLLPILLGGTVRHYTTINRKVWNVKAGKCTLFSIDWL